MARLGSLARRVRGFVTQESGGLASREIDVSPLLRGDGRSRTVALMRKNLAEVGFFIARGFEPVLPLENCYQLAREAHALPVAMKERCGAAYSGPDIGRPEPNYDGISGGASARAWDYSPHGLESGSASYPEGLAARFDEVYKCHDELGAAIAKAIAEAFELPLVCAAGFGTLRLMHYPAPLHTWVSANANSGDHAWTVDDDATGIAPHTDFEAFTVLNQTAPGLQLLINDTWIDAPSSPDSLTVILGDVIERFTNGVLKATPHRVVQEDDDSEANERYSIVRFHALHPDTLIRPLPKYVDRHNPAKYTPVTMRTHMQTTLRNLDLGLPSWDHGARKSISASYAYTSPTG